MATKKSQDFSIVGKQDVSGLLKSKPNSPGAIKWPGQEVRTKKGLVSQD